MHRIGHGANVRLEKTGGAGVFLEEAAYAAPGLAAAAKGASWSVDMRLEFGEGGFEALALFFPDGALFFDAARGTA